MSDDELIANYVKEFPACLPENNPTMREVLNSPNYEDRGMWGPYGGKHCTVSQLWLEDYKELMNGGVSEVGLMTIIEPPTES